MPTSMTLPQDILKTGRICKVNDGDLAIVVGDKLIFQNGTWCSAPTNPIELEQSNITCVYGDICLSFNMVDICTPIWTKSTEAALIRKLNITEANLKELQTSLMALRKELIDE